MAGLAWPGSSCANAVPRPRDTAAAAPAIQADNFLILESLLSRCAAAPRTGCGIIVSPAVD
ncbi:MAG TPA: hypothetical protein VFQ44_02530 [Streptosporangiaceae bacterium]|nr:hypothetical protein [Streptosporangiaceae bacterium]